MAKIDLERKEGLAVRVKEMRLPAAPNVDSASGRQVRLAGLAAATACFAAAAGLEGVALGRPAVACAPGALCAAWVAARALPSPAWTAPLSVAAGDVAVAPSPGRGEGLFTTRPIARGTFVADYLGEDLDEAGLAARYGTARREDSAGTAYLLELNGVFGLSPTFVDAVDPARSNEARFVNHAPRPNLRKVKQRFPDRRLRLYAARDIAVGEELFFDYGDSYWTGREGELR